MKPQIPELISIIIVNWNTRELLLQCIGSIYESTDLPFEIIVLDNASSDRSVEAVQSKFPEVKIIVSDKNLGFAAGNNCALKEAAGEYLLLLNPDTLVPDGSIKALLDFIKEHPEVGIAGPMLLGSDGRPQISSFGMYPSPMETAVRALRLWRVMPNSRLAKRFLISPDNSKDWVHTQHLLGACLMVRRKVMEQLGGFDDGFFLFLEETDLCCRAKLNGWEIAYFTGTHIIHLGEQSMQNILHKSGGLYIRSYNRFCNKYKMPPHRRLAVNLFLILGTMIEAAVALSKHRSIRRAGRSLQALWYGYFAKP